MESLTVGNKDKDIKNIEVKDILQFSKVTMS